MYKIEKAPYGFRLTFGGLLSVEETAQWAKEFVQMLPEPGSSFCVFVDMRTLIPLSHEAQVHMQSGQKAARKHGMKRSVVILNSPVITVQFRRIAGETGILEWERYIDASTEPNWEQVALDWIEKAIDPEIRQSVSSSV